MVSSVAPPGRRAALDARLSSRLRFFPAASSARLSAAACLCLSRRACTYYRSWTFSVPLSIGLGAPEAPEAVHMQGSAATRPRPALHQHAT